MKFSDQFKIFPQGNETWFDIILSIDTKLFLDPRLIEQFEFGVFVGAFDEITAYFKEGFEEAAKQLGSTDTKRHQKIESFLAAPEVEEICLGFTSFGTAGSGAGSGKAKVLREAMSKAAGLAVLAPERFETLQLFQRGIAEDTISDIVANVLRWRLAEYTRQICVEYNIPTVERIRQRGKFDLAKQRWVPIKIIAPINPYNGKQVLLCPKDFLSQLPVINPKSFWQHWFDSEVERLQLQFGDDVKRNVDKNTIVELAMDSFSTVEEFVGWVSRQTFSAYDVENDPKGLLKWYEATKEYAQNDLVKFKGDPANDFGGFIDYLIEEFDTFVNFNGGWKLLYSDSGKPRSEEICQLAFLGIVKFICYSHDIDIAKEANIGRGPVDFKFSRGQKHSALVEMKLLKNSRFWSGLQNQLPTYQKAEGVTVGRFLVVSFENDDIEKILNIEARTKEVSEKLSYNIESRVVEAPFKPPSASIIH